MTADARAWAAAAPGKQACMASKHAWVLAWARQHCDPRARSSSLAAAAVATAARAAGPRRAAT